MFFTNLIRAHTNAFKCIQNISMHSTFIYILLCAYIMHFILIPLHSHSAAYGTCPHSTCIRTHAHRGCARHLAHTAFGQHSRGGLHSKRFAFKVRSIRQHSHTFMSSLCIQSHSSHPAFNTSMHSCAFSSRTHSARVRHQTCMRVHSDGR